MKGFDPGIERSICRYKEGLGGLDFLLPEGKEGEEREGVLSHVRNCQSKRDRRPIAYHCKPVIARLALDCLGLAQGIGFNTRFGYFARSRQ